jgi:MIP family channel proteins
MMTLPRRALAEAIGTFLFCFVGAAAICVDHMQGDRGFGLLGIALAHGLTMSVAISALGKVSGGHFNPAVSITVAAARLMPLSACLVYVFSQLVGATLAGFAVRYGFPQGVYVEVYGGVPVPSKDFSVPVLIFLEAIATFFLLTAVFGTAVDPKAPQIGGFGIGLAIAADILAIGPITGASMNPARTFGPALAANVWDNHYIYWVGPILGGLIAGMIYSRFFLTRDDAVATAG